MTGHQAALCLVFFSLGIAFSQTVPKLGWFWRVRDRWGLAINGINVAAVIAACVMGMVYL
jgi:hypothetical protein